MANNYVDMEVGNAAETVQSLVNCVRKGKNHTDKPPPSIHMVPSVFRDLSPKSFKPRVVSIGPLHREDKTLQEFEVHKASSVHDLLHRLDCESEQMITLQSCVEKVNAKIQQIRECYAGMKTSYSDAELAKMMVMDACFILQVIYNFSNDCAIVRNLLLEASVICDLLLLENQIPFFVLNDIFECTILKSTKTDVTTTLSDFMYPFLNSLNPFRENLDRGYNIGTDTTDHPDHILGLLHWSHRPRDEINVSSDFPSSLVRCAVDLDRAGVRFKPNKHAKWSLAMEVELHRIPWLSWSWAKPALKMPVLHVHDDTELILRNLMAYEQSSLGCKFVTSYMAAMDMLVNTEDDIAMLVESKVLVNIIGSNDEAATMMNTICKELTWTHSFYNEPWMTILDDYCNGYWPKHVARLKRTYFNSPWSVIALVAGIVLFALTVVQTFYAIYSTKGK